MTSADEWTNEKHQYYELEKGDILDFALRLSDGRTVLLHIHTRNRTTLTIDAGIALPQPEKLIHLAPVEE